MTAPHLLGLNIGSKIILKPSICFTVCFLCMQTHLPCLSLLFPEFLVSCRIQLDFNLWCENSICKSGAPSSGLNGRRHKVGRELKTALKCRITTGPAITVENVYGLSVKPFCSLLVSLRFHLFNNQICSARGETIGRLEVRRLSTYLNSSIYLLKQHFKLHFGINLLFSTNNFFFQHIQNWIIIGTTNVLVINFNSIFLQPYNKISHSKNHQTIYQKCDKCSHFYSLFFF